MMDKDYILNSGLLEQYILGLTTPEESREVEHYAELYPEVKDELHAMGQAMEEYAKQFAIPAPPGIKNAILSEIDSMEQEAQVIQMNGTPKRKVNWAAWLSGAAAVLFGIFTLQYYSASSVLQTELNQVKSEFQAYQVACETNQAEQAESQKLFAMLSNERTIPVRLKGTNLAPEAQAVVYWNDKSESAYLNILNLPKPPEGKQYQIWADVEGKMVNMGLVSERSESFQVLNFIDHPESFNITLEPLGGSEEPTVSLLFVNGKV